MIRTLIKPFFIASILLIGMLSCDEVEELKDETLYVKFENSASSEYTITSIRMLPMGKAGDAIPEPTGEFSSNILDPGQTIAPGAHVFMTLEIPNLHYAVYRVTVDDGTGSQVYLYDQPNYSSSYEGVITHWGGDDRTVSVTIVWDDYSNLIVATGWSDWVGID